MRTLFKNCSALALLAMISMNAQAQRPGGGGFGFGRGMGTSLIMNSGVQKELKLTDEQLDKLQAVNKDLMANAKTNFEKFKEMSKDDRAKFFKEMSEKNNKAYAAILTKEQSARLKQIEIQQDVAGSLTTNAEVAKVINLTDEQKEKIKAIQDENRKEMSGLFKGGKGNFAELSTKMRTLRTESKEKILKVLTDSQMKSWKELTGAPYEVVFEGFKGGGRKKKMKDD